MVKRPRTRSIVFSAVIVLTVAAVIWWVGGRGDQAADTAHEVWKTAVTNAGVASPRLVDLNGDGIPDVLVGSGEEGVSGKVTALDGVNGRQLWSADLPDEVLATRPLIDVNGDGIRDIFVCGRTKCADFFVLNAVDGKTIWTLSAANPESKFPTTNFINVILVGDLDDDGAADVLIVQSGGYDEKRPPAEFYFVSSANGKILNRVTALDKRECYSVPLYEPTSDGPILYIGTGGETIDGHLTKLHGTDMKIIWRINSSGQLEIDQGRAVEIVDQQDEDVKRFLRESLPTFQDSDSNRTKQSALDPKGFIASPLLVDLDQDGKQEVIAPVIDGGIFCLDAQSGTIVWKWTDPWLVANYASPAVGYFNSDQTLDVVVFVSRGSFPFYSAERLVWLDGKTGKVLGTRAFGEFQFKAGSPLVLDVNHDGIDEVLVSVNTAMHPGVKNPRFKLAILDGRDLRRELLSKVFDGFSIATPVLSDMDGTGVLDLVHTELYHVHRLTLDALPIDSGGKPAKLPKVKWGEFRGPNANGRYTGDGK